jgi:hypothetical protein
LTGPAGNRRKRLVVVVGALLLVGLAFLALRACHATKDPRLRAYEGQHGLWWTANCSFADWISVRFSLSADGLTLTAVGGDGPALSPAGGSTVKLTRTAAGGSRGIVGDWRVTYGAPAVLTISLDGSTYTAKAKTPVRVTGSSCDLAPGTIIATFSATAAPTAPIAH